MTEFHLLFAGRFNGFGNIPAEALNLSVSGRRTISILVATPSNLSWPCQGDEADMCTNSCPVKQKAGLTDGWGDASTKD
jgi:hypothetical protein